MDTLQEINELANLTKSLYLAMKDMPTEINALADNVILSNIVNERMQNLRNSIFED